MFSSVKNIHFVGIGGIGMSGIAEILLKEGFSISGSDMNQSDNTDYLKNLGAKIFIGHAEENIDDAEVVVYSSAVKIDKNVETQAAKDRNIPLIRRAEMLAEVSRLNYCVAVAGTHGKTTTTSMVALPLINGGIDPTVLVGGRLSDFGGTNARLGKGKWTVVEADEYDRSFLQLLPTFGIINNIEPEHMDIYKDEEDLMDTFVEFANKVPFYGFLALGLDSKLNRQILQRINKKVITFGLSRHADVRGAKLEHDGIRTSFDVLRENELLGRVTINIPGEHNVRNALASITIALELEVPFETIATSLANFKGVMRRFELKGSYNGADIIDDYAHHPSEVSATIAAARAAYGDKRIIAIFQPHTFTRTKNLYQEFGESFDEADSLIVTGIYPAREEPIEGVTGDLISDAASDYGHKDVAYFENLEDIAPAVKGIIDKDSVVVCMGAGPIWKVANELAGKNK
ncbi:MAG: UDP-N-acetylmuramate--L-alanine ligase [Candidatus Kapaibacteriales bacterium]